jgi:hypothetical protein
MRLFALDLSATDAAGLSGLKVSGKNTIAYDIRY